MLRKLTFADAIHESMHQAMTDDHNVIAYGLGINDPKAIFGTTRGLEDSFGCDRIFDMPASENAMTGVAIGAALNGIRPVMVHQRLDFFLLAMDQLVNSAAKWHFMFGGKRGVPMTIRLICGRGWGQGPTHSQNLHAWFGHIPGLKVVMPTSAEDAKGLLTSSIFDDNPVLFLEHRWLHNVLGNVPTSNYRIPIGKANLVREGDAVSIVSMSYMTVEAIHAANFLAQQGIYCDVIDLRTIRPLDWPTVFASVKRTGHLLALDTGHMTGSVGGEILARVSSECWSHLKGAPQRIAMPDYAEGTSPALTRAYHPRAEDIVTRVASMIGTKIDISPLIAQRAHPNDVPGDWFAGPF